MPRISQRAAREPSKATPEARAARFERGGILKTGVTEASDVVALPNGRFLIVGDKTDSAVVVDAKGHRTRIELAGLKNGKSQLEAVAYDPIRQHLFVAREEAGELLRYEWNALKSEAKPVLEKRIELHLDGPRNKGIEGLAYLPQTISPTGQPQLLLAKEGKPRSLELLDDKGKGKTRRIELQREVTAVCRDFSAAAIDPKTGNLFLASDESAAIAQVSLVRDGEAVRGKLVQSFPLVDDKGKRLARVEGLTFNEHGDLFVLTENDGKLHSLQRK